MLLFFCNLPATRTIKNEIHTQRMRGWARRNQRKLMSEKRNKNNHRNQNGVELKNWREKNTHAHACTLMTSSITSMWRKSKSVQDNYSRYFVSECLCVHCAHPLPLFQMREHVQTCIHWEVACAFALWLYWFHACTFIRKSVRYMSLVNHRMQWNIFRNNSIIMPICAHELEVIECRLIKVLLIISHYISRFKLVSSVTLFDASICMYEVKLLDWATEPIVMFYILLFYLH